MIKVDEEFQSLIPPLTVDEYTQLEKNIIKDGIRDPLVVWSQDDGSDILIDGHNRWKISAAHGGIKFNIVRKDFDSREDAKTWIILNQFGRRNLEVYDRSLLALKLKPMIAKKAKEQQIRKSVSQKSVEQKPIDTQKELAKLAGVSHDTIHKVETIEKSNDETLIQQVRSGETSINRAYNTVMGIERPKTPQQSKKDLIDHLKQKHEAFEEKKSNGVVQFAEIKQDKNNQEFIAKDLLIRCMRMGDAIERIMFENEQGDVSLTEMAKTISKTDREKLEGYIQKIKNTLSEILMEVVIE